MNKAVLMTLLVLLAAEAFGHGTGFYMSCRGESSFKEGMEWTVEYEGMHLAVGIGNYEGEFKVDYRYVEKYYVDLVSSDTVTFLVTGFDTGDYKLTGWFINGWANKPSWVDAPEGGYEYEWQNTVKISQSGKIQYNKEAAYSVGSHSWLVSSLEDMESGSVQKGLWDQYAHYTDRKMSTHRSTFTISNRSVDVWEAWLTYETKGWYTWFSRSGATGTDDCHLYYDKSIGILVGEDFAGTYEGGSEKSRIRESFIEKGSLDDSNIIGIATFDSDPRISTIDIDGGQVSAENLPKSYLWLLGSTHTVTVPQTAKYQEKNYIFKQWNGGSTETARSITMSKYLEDFRATYEIQPETTSSTAPTTTTRETSTERIDGKLVGTIAIVIIAFVIGLFLRKKSRVISAASSTKSFCMKCGAELPSDAEFCEKCGTRRG